MPGSPASPTPHCGQKGSAAPKKQASLCKQLGGGHEEGVESPGEGGFCLERGGDE